jgi:tetraacyldisaccharide 4'-kinase
MERMGRKVDRRGVLARAARAGGALGLARRLLRPAGWLYGRAGLARRRAYRSGLLRSERLEAPVISVGNITTGGAGKTPVVEFIARRCLALGRRPAVLSRGYGAPSAGSKNDEALLLERRLPGVAQFPDPDRVAAGRRALRDGADCLILDDGFQHRRIRRDLDLVLIDALDPFGGGACLPAGTLREPLDALDDADALIITRADTLDPPARELLRARLGRLAPGKPVMECVHRPVSISGWNVDLEDPPGLLIGKRVFLFRGIGNPEAFRRTVESLEGVEVVSAWALPDHFAYDPRTLGALGRECDASGADLALTTEKDLVKIRDAWPSRRPLRALRIEIEFTSGGDRFLELLEHALKR